jgi:hypothetical protein
MNWWQTWLLVTGSQIAGAGTVMLSMRAWFKRRP